MEFELRAQAAQGYINTVALSWEGNTGRYVTVYRSESEISLTPAEGEEIDWSGAVKVADKVTDSGVHDAGLEPGTYYYYATDGIETVAATGNGVMIPAGTQYAPEIQPDYQAVPLNKVTESAAYMQALNSSGSVKLNTLKVPAGYLTLVAIARSATPLVETEIGQILLGNGITGFAILQSGKIESFDGYEAQLSGSTQVKYVAAK